MRFQDAASLQPLVAGISTHVYAGIGLDVGSLEYGPPPGFTAGQVRGGRWKPLHYFYKRSLMRDVMATCGEHSPPKNGTSACYISNHGAGTTFNGTVTLTAYDHFGTGAGVSVLTKHVEMAAGPGTIEWFDADLPAGNTTSTSFVVICSVDSRAVRFACKAGHSYRNCALCACDVVAKLHYIGSYYLL